MSALTDLFSNIADAIRYKKGTSSSIVASDFPSEVMSIPSSNDGYKFKQSIAPTHWDTNIRTGLEYSTTDNYGLWKINASSYDGRKIINAFDPPYEPDGTVGPTLWVSSDVSEAQPTPTVEMLFPVQILPQVVTLYNSARLYDSAIKIYFSASTSGDDWTLLGTLTNANDQSNPVSITTANFYRRMKLVCEKGTSQYFGTKFGFFNIEITEGYWKEA